MQHAQALIVSFILFFLTLCGNSGIVKGIGPSTQIMTEQGLRRVDQVYHHTKIQHLPFASFNVECHCVSWQYLHAIAQGTANAHFHISIDPARKEHICCLPGLLLYSPERRTWMRIDQLQVGDIVQCMAGPQKISFIELVPEPITVYELEIENTHVFCIGQDELLAHNMLLPLATGIGVEYTLGISSALATAGTPFGPATIIGGCLIGGLIGILLDWREKQNKRAADFSYYVPYTIDKNQYPWFNTQDKKEDTPIAKPEKAPGKPTENDGYEPPKNWDGKKVKHPKTGQVGWPDKQGEVWVPTGIGPTAHGGPHWDVISKDGKGHRNVMPGGRIRGKK